MESTTVLTAVVRSVIIVLLLQRQIRPLNSQSTSTTLSPSTAVRLTGGKSNRDGLVTINYRGQWGTICDDGWTVQDAAVICRMLGFTGLATAVASSTGLFGPGPSDLIVWWRVVQCQGNEQDIAYCPFQLNNGACGHQQDAGVFCLGDLLTSSAIPSTTVKLPPTTTLPPRICNTPSTTVRLVASDGSIGYAEGRVQILHNTVWLSICDNQWGLQNAQVICRMLCFNPANARATLGSSYYGNATEGYWLSDVQCSGTELDVVNCAHSSWLGPSGVSVCDLTEPAGVSCLPNTLTLPPVPVPLVTCDNNMITAKFSLAADPLLTTRDLSVVEPDGSLDTSCGYTVTQDTNFVSISIPFVQCNTSRQVNSTHVIYSNVVRYSVPSTSPIITRSQAYNVSVSCQLPRQADPVSSVGTNTRTAPPQAGNGQFVVQLIMFADNKFQTPIASGTLLTVVLGGLINVGVQLFSSDTTLKLVLNKCFASPTADPSSQPTYSLISNKCAVEPTLTFYPINSTVTAFTFQSFQFILNGTTTNVVYLHCTAYTCALADNAGNCDPSCSSGGRRRRRDASRVNGQSAADLTSDPIIIVESTALIHRASDNNNVVASALPASSMSPTLIISATNAATSSTFTWSCGCCYWDILLSVPRHFLIVFSATTAAAFTQLASVGH